MRETARPRPVAAGRALAPVVVALILVALVGGACHRQAATGAGADAVPAARSVRNDDTNGPRHCRALAERACGETAGCQVVKGTAATGGPQYAGCFTAVVNGDPLLCAESLTCAKAPPGDGRCLRFSSSCVPDDWTLLPTCADPACPPPSAPGAM